VLTEKRSSRQESGGLKRGTSLKARTPPPRDCVKSVDLCPILEKKAHFLEKS